MTCWTTHIARISRTASIVALLGAQSAHAFDDVPSAAFFSHDHPASEFAPTPELKSNFSGSTTRRYQARTSIQAMVTEAAMRYGVPVALAHGIVRIESRYNCRARSRSGAVGIMQTLPRTAAGVGIHGSLTDCARGLEAGMRYLKLALDMHGAGCAGASSFERGLNAPSRCTSYGRKVMALAASG